MVIEAERALVGRPSSERKYAIALIARPLLAGLEQGFANTIPFCGFTCRKFPDVGLAFARKVRFVRDGGEAKAFPLVILCYEDHGRVPMLIDAIRNPALNSADAALRITPRWHPDRQAWCQAEYKRAVIGMIGSYTNHTLLPSLSACCVVNSRRSQRV